MIGRHHHHVGEMVLFHSHAEVDTSRHGIHVVAKGFVDFEPQTLNDMTGFYEECRERTCAMRRHDDG